MRIGEPKPERRSRHCRVFFGTHLRPRAGTASRAQSLGVIGSDIGALTLSRLSLDWRRQQCGVRGRICPGRPLYVKAGECGPPGTKLWAKGSVGGAERAGSEAAPAGRGAPQQRP